MSGKVIFESENHKVVLFEELTPASAVQSNQYLIIHNGEGMLLDPGGHKVFSQLKRDISPHISPGKLRYIFLSHQDPDIVAALNGWLLTTNAEAYISKLWLRFLPHFGLEKNFEERVKPIEDKGTRLDPCSKILFSGDLGASLNQPYFFVENFEEHIKYMEGFHKRYMASNKILKLWANMVRKLDIEMIAPQHGAIFKGKELVNKFINWAENLKCGVDLMDESIYSLP